MINEQAANAFKTAKTLTALYTRLDLARDCITIALDALPKDFDIHQTGRINDIRNILSREMSNIWDLRESEERRICEQLPETPPAENRQLAGSEAQTDSPNDWVTQDLVPPREQIDQIRYTIDDEHWNVACGKWSARHGDDFGSAGQLLVRCRRKDLPTKNRQLAASDSLAQRFANLTPHQLEYEAR